MTEPLFKRVQRVVAAGAETAVDAAERLSGTSLLRHAVRELEQAEALVERQRRTALGRQQQANRDLAVLERRHGQLAEDVRFALEKKREDLAQAAVEAQIDLEAQIADATERQRLAAEEGKRLDAEQRSLAARKADMHNEAAALTKAQLQARAATPDLRVQRKAQRAEAAFSRARSSIGVATAPAGSSGAELAELRRAELVAERLADMSAGTKTPAAKPRAPKSRA